MLILTAHLLIVLHRRLCGLHQQSPQKHVPLFRDRTQTTLVPRTPLPRNQAKVAGHLLATRNTPHIPDRHHKRKRRQRAYPRLGHQQTSLRIPARHLIDRNVQILQPDISCVNDIVHALWCLNRHAKRLRDGVSTNSTITSNMIYDRKGQALYYLESEGRLNRVGYPRFSLNNRTEILASDSVTFHRPCSPVLNVECKTIGLRIEAKPMEEGELSLELAYDVVDAYLEGRKRVPIYVW